MGNVKEFTTHDFEKLNPQKLNDSYKDKITFVKFFSPNCVHCINSQPDFEKLATTLKDDSKYVIAEFDCTKYPDFMGLLQGFKYGFTIRGYPSFIIFVNSLYYQTYKDDREINQYLNTLANIQTI